MCGIAGVQGSFPSDLLKRMTDSVAHRGPDGEGELWIDVPNETQTGLGHRRLAIIDLSSAGCQPMVLPPSGAAGASITLVFNGEIYNYRNCARNWRPRGTASRRKRIRRCSCICTSATGSTRSTA